MFHFHFHGLQAETLRGPRRTRRGLQVQGGIPCFSERIHKLTQSLRCLYLWLRRKTIEKGAGFLQVILRIVLSRYHFESAGFADNSNVTRNTENVWPAGREGSLEHSGCEWYLEHGVGVRREHRVRAAGCLVVSCVGKYKCKSAEACFK